MRNIDIASSLLAALTLVSCQLVAERVVRANGQRTEDSNAEVAPIHYIGPEEATLARARTRRIARLETFRQGVLAIEQREPSISVMAYNHADAAADVFGHAKSTIERIFAAAGVVVSWLDPSGPEAAPRALRLVVRRHAEDATLPLMGKAIAGGNGCSGTAFVFYAVVLEYAHRGEHDPSAVLAYAMAHELGHLLLPPPAHADRGVMRPRWDGDDLRHVADGSLAFTMEEARAIASTASACDGRELRNGTPIKPRF
jgi:hypothetical protein